MPPKKQTAATTVEPVAKPAKKPTKKQLAAEAAAAEAAKQAQAAATPVQAAAPVETAIATPAPSSAEGENKDSKPDKLKEKILAILAEAEYITKLEKEYDNLLYAKATKNGRNQDILVDELEVKYKEYFGTELDPRVVAVLRKYDRFRFAKTAGPAIYEFEGIVEIEPKYHIHMGTIMHHAKALQELTRILPPIDASEEQKLKFEMQPVTVLDIGCGTGYLTACMADLIGISWKHRVVALDLHNSICTKAMDNVCSYPGLNKAYERGIIKFVYGDGLLGFDYKAPYNFVNYSFRGEGIPVSVAEQLTLNGYALAPVDDEYMLVVKKAVPNPDRPSSYKLILDTEKVGNVPSNMQTGATEELIEDVLPYSSFQRPVDEEYMLTDYELAMISQDATQRAQKFKKEEERQEIERQYEEEGYRKTTLEEIQALAGINLEEMVLQSLAAAGITSEALSNGGYQMDLSDPRIRTITTHTKDAKGNPVTNTTNDICFGTARPPPSSNKQPPPGQITISNGKVTNPGNLQQQQTPKIIDRSDDDTPMEDPMTILRERRAARLAKRKEAEAAAAAGKAVPQQQQQAKPTTTQQQSASNNNNNGLNALSQLINPATLKMLTDKLNEAARSMSNNTNRATTAATATPAPVATSARGKKAAAATAPPTPAPVTADTKPKRGRPKKE